MNFLPANTELRTYLFMYGKKQDDTWRNLKTAIAKAEKPNLGATESKDWDYAVCTHNDKLSQAYFFPGMTVIVGEPPKLTLVQRLVLKLFGIKG